MENISTNAETSASLQSNDQKNNIYKELAGYRKPSIKKSFIQIVNTFLPYITLWITMLMILKHGYGYWPVLLLSIPTAFLHVRIFIIFHDCCHGSFFRSRLANKIVGYICGIITFTPFDQWQSSHAKHHATSGNLDQRGTGDVWTMTVEEYLSSSKWKQFGYRCFRNPLVLFGLVPVLLFLVSYRFPDGKKDKRKTKSVIYTNLGMAAIFAGVIWTFGWQMYLMVLVPVLLFAGTTGVWLFFIQHQYENAYWSRQEQWTPLQAVLQGSSYYKLPKILQWCTGNIGLHHIHHLQPRIANYYLQQCYDEIPALQEIAPITIRSSFKSLKLKLWDEQQKKLVAIPVTQ